MRLLVAILLISGCGFHRVGGSDASVGDMGISDVEDLAGLPPGDDLTGIPPGSDLATISAACPSPQLLVGIENLHNGDTGGGRVARLGVYTTGVDGCTTLRGQGTIGPQPQAVAGFENYVAAAALDGLYLVDPATDTVKWSRSVPLQSGWGPINVLPIMSATNLPLVAVAYGMYGNPSTIREIYLYDDNGFQSSSSPWCIQETGCSVNLPLSLQILGITRDPATPTKFLALDPTTPAAALDVDGWAMPNPTKATYVGQYSGAWGTINAVMASTTERVAWATSDNMGEVMWANDAGGGSPSVQGPLKCSSGCATILDVVPDATTLDQFFILCDGASVDTRSVWRLTTAGDCTKVLDGAQFGSESRLSSIAIAQ